MRGVLLLSGAGSLADYGSVVRSIVYNNTADPPNTATRTLRFAANDATTTGPVTLSIVETAAPVFDPTRVWVDFGHEGTETGTLLAPFDTLAEATVAVSEGGTVCVKGYSPDPVGAESPLRITRKMRIEAAGGTVRVE